MEKLINNIIELMKFKSVSGNQDEIAKVFKWIKKHYVTDGVYVKEWFFDQASPVMLLSNCKECDFDIVTIGHIDVVPAKDELFVPNIKDGRLYGRGGFDMKASVAVCLDTLLYTLKKNVRYGVLITSDEETTSNGMKALQKADIISAKAVFDTDISSDIGEIVEKYKHPVSVELKAQGKNAHSSRPWEGKNAVNALVDAIKILEKYFPQYQLGGNQPKSTWIDTMVVTALNSPTTYNVVPQSAVARLNFRLTEKTSLEKLESILRDVCKECGCAYKVLLSSSGVYMDVNNPIIKHYAEVAEKVLGKKIKFSTACGATDSRMFAQKSAIIMHGISGANAHGDDEYADINSILTLAKIQRNFIDSLI